MLVFDRYLHIDCLKESECRATQNISIEMHEIFAVPIDDRDYYYLWAHITSDCSQVKDT